MNERPQSWQSGWYDTDPGPAAPERPTAPPPPGDASPPTHETLPPVGGPPTLVVHVPAPTEENLGYLIYFFEKACAISGYMLGVNPFDQPGVESYKKNMFALLGKPGYEAQKAELEAKLR